MVVVVIVSLHFGNKRVTERLYGMLDSKKARKLSSDDPAFIVARLRQCSSMMKTGLPVCACIGVRQRSCHWNDWSVHAIEFFLPQPLRRFLGSWCAARRGGSRWPHQGVQSARV